MTRSSLRPRPTDAPRHGARPRRRRGLAVVRSWWPEVLAAVLGLVLLAHRGGVVTLEDAAEVFLRLVFVMALAAVVIGDTMRFITWWFWTRQQP